MFLPFSTQLLIWAPQRMQLFKPTHHDPPEPSLSKPLADLASSGYTQLLSRWVEEGETQVCPASTNFSTTKPQTSPIIPNSDWSSRQTHLY